MLVPGEHLRNEKQMSTKRVYESKETTKIYLLISQYWLILVLVNVNVIVVNYKMTAASILSAFVFFECENCAFKLVSVCGHVLFCKAVESQKY